MKLSLHFILAAHVGHEGVSFEVECPNCGRTGQNEMCEIDIPGENVFLHREGKQL